MELSAEVGSEKVTATLGNGVLELTVLKVAKEQRARNESKCRIKRTPVAVGRF